MTVSFAALLVLFFWRTFWEWLRLSQTSADASHLFLMPAVTGCLLYWRRADILAHSRFDIKFAPILLLVFLACVVANQLKPTSWAFVDSLSLRVLLLVVVWITGFGLIHGVAALRESVFALSVLLLMIPIPSYVLNHVIHFLQSGSAHGTAVLLSLSGTAYYRDGFTFVLPGVAIEIAEECSGIRSSIALLITALLVSHLYLSANISKTIFVLSVLPLAIVKNSIRIVTLSLLALRVDRGFLTGDLHYRGGIVFFVITLLLLWLVFRVLRWWEGRWEGREAAKVALESVGVP